MDEWIDDAILENGMMKVTISDGLVASACRTHTHTHTHTRTHAHTHAHDTHTLMTHKHLSPVDKTLSCCLQGYWPACDRELLVPFPVVRIVLVLIDPSPQATP